jgi:hypothetical protein
VTDVVEEKESGTIKPEHLWVYTRALGLLSLLTLCLMLLIKSADDIGVDLWLTHWTNTMTQRLANITNATALVLAEENKSMVWEGFFLYFIFFMWFWNCFCFGLVSFLDLDLG